MGYVDTSYNVDTSTAIPTDIVQQGAAGDEVTANDSWGGLFRDLGKSVLGYSIEKDRALTSAQIQRQQSPAVRQLPNGQYMPATSGGMGTMLLVGAAVLVAGVLIVKAVK